MLAWFLLGKGTCLRMGTCLRTGKLDFRAFGLILGYCYDLWR